MGPLLLLIATAAAETVRASRLAMGTVVGVTVVVEDPTAAGPAIEAAYAAIEAGEAALSEWRPDSATARLSATGGPVALDAEAVAVFRYAEALRVATEGSFDVTWRAPRCSDGARVSLREAGSGWILGCGDAVTAAPVDLGGLLKGWLNDRAGAALRAAGIHDFLVDAAGDILASGDAEGGDGWLVDVVAETGRVATIRLRDAALSTSGNAGQPGHIRDANTGEARDGDRVVTVVAPSGLVADGLATAIYAGGWRPGLAEAFGACALETGAAGTRRSRGARRVFRARIPAGRW